MFLAATLALFAAIVLRFFDLAGTAGIRTFHWRIRDDFRHPIRLTRTTRLTLARGGARRGRMRLLEIFDDLEERPNHIGGRDHADQ
jgi:hypothetical protein